MRTGRVGRQLAVVIIAAAGYLGSVAAASATQPDVAPAGQPVPLDHVVSAWTGYDARQMVAALEQAIARGEHALVEDLLARPETIARVPSVDRHFLTGLAMKNQGRPREAIAHFRAALADHPQHNPARLHLAHAQFQIDDDENARQNFQFAIAGAQSMPEIENLARGFIDQIDKRGRLSTHVYTAIAPSTNVNQASSARVVMLNGLPFEIDARHRATSGIGLHAGAGVGYRVPVLQDVDLVPAIAFDAKRYRHSAFNDTVATGSLGPRFRADWGHTSFSAVTSLRWLADEVYSFKWGGRWHGQYRLGSRTVINADAQCERRHYADDWTGSDMRYQDGSACSLGGHVDVYLANGASFARALASLEREWINDAAHLSLTGWRVGVGLAHDLPFGITTYTQLLYTSRAFEGVYPGATSPRDDRRTDASVMLKKRDLDLFGFTPALQYTYTRNVSNIPFFDFHAHGVTVTLTRQF